MLPDLPFACFCSAAAGRSLTWTSLPVFCAAGPDCLPLCPCLPLRLLVCLLHFCLPCSAFPAAACSFVLPFLLFFALLLHATVGLLCSLQACKRPSFIQLLSGHDQVCDRAQGPHTARCPRSRIGRLAHGGSPACRRPFAAWAAATGSHIVGPSNWCMQETRS
jgi:hypothetical protein